MRLSHVLRRLFVWRQTSVSLDEDLNLARGYVEMAKGELAKPLLKKILKKGDESQKNEAQSLWNTLST